VTVTPGSAQSQRRRHDAGALLAGVRLLSPREARRAAGIALATLVASTLEIVAVAAVLPLINVVVQPDAMRKNGMLNALYRWSGAQNESDFVYLVGAGVLAAMAVSAVAGWALLYVQNRYAASCQSRLGTELLHRCLAAPYAWFLGRNSTLLSRLVYDDIVIWSRSYVQRLTMMGKDALVILMAIGLVLALSPRTGIAVLASVALLGYASVVAIRPLLTRLATVKREALGATMLTAQQALAGIKDVKLSSRERYFGGLFRAAYATVADAHAALNVWQETPTFVMRFLAQFALVTLALAFWRMGIGSGQIATQLALLVVVTTKVVPAVSTLSAAVNSLVNAVPHVAAIEDTLVSIAAATVRNEDEARAPVGEWHTIRFDRVGYSYPGASDRALVDVTMELKRPGSYGIVGRSAAGKSTLVDLLVRLLDPTEGQLWIDSRPARALDRADWQRRIGYVPQSPFITDDTLRANVAFGVPRETVDDRWVAECLRMANLGTLTGELEHGLDTRLGERGSRLSGGQRQRVAIARALFNRPEILVLDEATSSLDTASEQEILAALKDLAGRVTIVTIAHRASTVSVCEEIVVLEDGRISMKGPFAELRERQELFRRMAATV
jgi:ATP-binding cassette, subfamily B, bacterial PglK